MPFFPRTIAHLGEIPVICYIEADDFLIERANSFKKAEEFLSTVFFNLEQQDILTGYDHLDFILAFVWPNDGVTNIDLWLNSGLGSYGPCEPKLDQILTYSGNRLATVGDRLGIGCGDTRIISGLEELYRRDVMASSGDLEHYIHGPGPKLPHDMYAPWQE